MAVFRLFLMALFLVVSSLGGAAAGERLVVATEGDYPPFSYLDEKGKLAGFDVDMAQALCRAMGRECELVRARWEDLLPGLVSGRWRMVVASMAYSPERAEKAEFTDAYFRGRSCLVGRARQKVSFDAAGLAGKTVAVQNGTVQARFMERRFAGVATIMTAPTMNAAFDLLADGKADLVFVGNLAALPFLTGPRGKSFDYVGEPTGDEEVETSARIQVPKGDTGLRNEVNAAILAIRKDGSYDRINRKYFPFSIY